MRNNRCNLSRIVLRITSLRAITNMDLLKTVLFVFILVFLSEGTLNDQSKRLLIDGTDATGSRISHLEVNQQMLTQIVNRMNSTITELVSRNSLLDNTNKLQDGLIHQLQRTISDLQTTSIRQQSVITSLQGVLSHIHTETQTTQPNPTSEATEVGSSYIRWGSRHCPVGKVEIVYSGYGGAQHYSGNGGPAGMLCLPNNPEISNTTTIVGSSYIYGMEYEENIFKPDAYNEDVPCALCRSRDSYSSVMIPGRMTCYPGWKREYYGYLSSGSTGHTSSDYICVDINPEYTPGGQADKGGKLLYVSSIVCGSMPCPPYKHAIPLYCVVCSK